MPALTTMKLKAEELERLTHLLSSEKGSDYDMLGYAINLETGKIRDLLSEDNSSDDGVLQILTILLSHYSASNPVARTEILIKFRNLPGGYAYERAFHDRAVQPILQVFGDNPTELVASARLLKGEPLSYGDVSVEIPTLEGIPLVYILWARNEFPASATLLYDESACHYLPTEDLAILAELTTNRLLKARLTLKKK